MNNPNVGGKRPTLYVTFSESGQHRKLNLINPEDGTVYESTGLDDLYATVIYSEYFNQVYLSQYGFSRARDLGEAGGEISPTYADRSNGVLICDGESGLKKYEPKTAEGVVALAVDAVRSIIYYAYPGGNLKQIDAADLSTGEVFKSYAIPFPSQDICLNPITNMLYMITPNRPQNAVGALDLNTGRFNPVADFNASELKIALDEVNNILFVADLDAGDVYSIDLTSGLIKGKVGFGRDVSALAFDRVKSRLITASLRDLAIYVADARSMASPVKISLDVFVESFTLDRGSVFLYVVPRGMKKILVVDLEAKKIVRELQTDADSRPLAVACNI